MKGQARKAKAKAAAAKNNDNAQNQACMTVYLVHIQSKLAAMARKQMMKYLMCASTSSTLSLNVSFQQFQS